ncbi:hypothetical protein QBC41DRAFT_394145 [Cercophora samala]|uniref:Uncharacterized protein n=1 Tax=Cercophora samala TaxID=330535 RepID=A0AA39ZM03_9PEZI|nr:hypothetical protein QBC41DRAFT_394145 [Cercophora samala]
MASYSPNFELGLSTSTDGVNHNPASIVQSNAAADNESDDLTGLNDDGDSLFGGEGDIVFPDEIEDLGGSVVPTTSADSSSVKSHNDPPKESFQRVGGLTLPSLTLPVAANNANNAKTANTANTASSAHTEHVANVGSGQRVRTVGKLTLPAVASNTALPPPITATSANNDNSNIVANVGSDEKTQAVEGRLNLPAQLSSAMDPLMDVPLSHPSLSDSTIDTPGDLLPVSKPVGHMFPSEGNIRPWAGNEEMRRLVAHQQYHLASGQALQTRSLASERYTLVETQTQAPTPEQARTEAQPARPRARATSRQKSAKTRQQTAKKWMPPANDSTTKVPSSNKRRSCTPASADTNPTKRARTNGVDAEDPSLTIKHVVQEVMSELKNEIQRSKSVFEQPLKNEVVDAENISAKTTALREKIIALMQPYTNLTDIDRTYARASMITLSGLLNQCVFQGHFLGEPLVQGPLNSPENGPAKLSAENAMRRLHAKIMGGLNAWKMSLKPRHKSRPDVPANQPLPSPIITQKKSWDGPVTEQHERQPLMPRPQLPQYFPHEQQQNIGHAIHVYFRFDTNEWWTVGQIGTAGAGHGDGWGVLASH